MPDQILPLVLPLSAASDRSLVGGKAAELARLMGEGFPVPDGFVVTTAAFRSDPDEAGTIPEPVREAVAQALTGFPGPLAYRSSAVAEDLASASFAGQYESVLDVVGLGAGLRAIQTCWDSGRLDRVDAYRDTFALGDASADMAVLVQRMVAAEAAGVAFGADPVTGANRVVIEATVGVGEGLLAGEITPERWALDVDGTVSVDRLEVGPVLTEDQAAEVAAMCRRIEDVYGSPQDIEWAFADGALHVLQSRPITALPVEPQERPPAGQTWELSDGFFPEPVLPLSYSAWLPLHSASWEYVFEKLGMPVQTIGHARYFGRVYDRLIPLGNPAKDRGLPPLPILKLAIRLAPIFRKRIDLARRAVREDLLQESVDWWEEAGRAELQAENKALLDTDLERLGDGDLADHLETIMRHVLAAGIAHFEVASATFASAGQLGIVMERTLGWKPERVTDLLQGHGAVSVEDGNAIRAVAGAIRALPDGLDLLDDPNRLIADPGPAGQAIRAFLDIVGHRTVGHDLAQPTWGEDPTPVIHLIRHHLDHEELTTDPRQGAARAEEEAKAAIQDPGDREEFLAALDRARRHRPYGDETEPYVAAATGLIRRVALEASRRLSRSGVIARPDDVFYLTVGELSAAIRTGRVDADIELRRAEHRWALANPAPRLIGPEPGPPPPLEVFPADVQPFIGAFLWAVANSVAAPSVADGEDGVIRGLAASPGRATGTARIVRSPAEFDKIRAGDIVVCTMTMAAWSPIFPVISGLITEQGGPLSHPGTLAREYGLPAVLGVAGATSLLADGQRVTIDGGAGTIEIL